MRSFVFKKQICLMPHFWKFISWALLKELSSYRAFVVIWGNLSNSFFLRSQAILVLTSNFFRLGLLLKTVWISTLANILWKRGLLMNFAFSNLKILQISFLKGCRLPGRTILSLPSSWKTVVNTIIIHKQSLYDEDCGEQRFFKQVNQPYQHWHY